MQWFASRLTIRSLLLAATFAAPLSGRLGAQDTSSAKPPSRYRTRVLGVFDDQSGEPLEGVRVLDVLNGVSAVTTKTGTVSLAFLPDGGSMVRLQHIGFATQTFMVKISPADTAPLTIMMSHVAELPKVVTTDSSPKYLSPRLRGFASRMKTESGYFIDEATLRKNDGRSVANLLMTKPGVQIHRGMSSSAYIWRSPRCANGGPPQVYLDGVALSPLKTDDPAQIGATKANSRTVFGMKTAESPDDPDLLPFNLADFNISDLAGIEWYPDGTTVPAEFSHTSGRCGALMLWTRER